jgi:hypothetical protein
MGNKATFIDQKFSSEIVDKFSYLPAVGDVVNVTPCFQCSWASSIKQAGDVAKARIISVRRGYNQEEVEDEDPGSVAASPVGDTKDWTFIVLAEMLEPTRITPYCGHVRVHLEIPIGLEVCLLHSNQYGTICEPKGWIVKNKAG